MKNQTTTALFALFLGCLGAHLFYIGKTTRGIIYIAFWVFGLFNFMSIGLIVFFPILALCIHDFIYILTRKPDEWTIIANQHYL